MRHSLVEENYDAIIPACLGVCQALLCVDGCKTRIRWFSESGKEQKSVPAVVKADYGAELLALKERAKQIEQNLAVQRSRFEGFYLSDRRFTYEYWLEKIVGHSLLGLLARKLIWFCQDEDRAFAGIWGEEGMVTLNGVRWPAIAGTAAIQLWHPLQASRDDIISWRSYLEEKRICQPFKQAFREIYLLTDAERLTGTYSNRFAAHILRQNQFAALARQRDWKYTLITAFDGSGDSSDAERALNEWGLNAHYCLQCSADDDHFEGGSYRFVSTDRIFFTREGREVALDTVPPVVFSEIMRDADLFTGVSSIGNDPQWTDHRTGTRHQTYWQSHSFGALSEVGATRKAALERLLPRLRIAGRCRIDGRFLIVRGQLRTYRIHLGSSNILMEPDDAYLCIVPGKEEKEVDNLFLPFEDDRMLSIIISKAMMLADDDRIKDQTILSQIKS